MRRADSIPSATEALKACEAMLRAQDGLKLLLPQLPPGSTLDDARRFRERLLQSQRRPSACMRSLLDERP